MWNKLIIILVILFGVIAVAQIMRVSELSQKLSGRKGEEIPEEENNFNAKMMIGFMVFFFASMIFLLCYYWTVGLGPAASVHGQWIDNLGAVVWTLIFIVFFITNTLLFVFAYKYRRKAGVKAYFLPHNDKLELVWTLIPAITLTFIVVFGLHTWHEVTTPATSEYEDIEVFSYQFAWTTRYSGQNGVLGNFDYKLTTDENPYALMTRDNIEKSLQLMRVGEPGVEGIEMLEKELSDKSIVLSKEKRKAKEKELQSKERMAKLLEAMAITYNDSIDDLANDDVIVEDSLFLLKGQKYNFHFRSKDVIHSAYFPHFRAQVNTVPGMTTFFKIQPRYSTDEMREILDEPDFDYALLCNKVCGTSHFKMKMTVKVLEPEEFLAWQKKQKTYDGSDWIKGNDKDWIEYYTQIANSVEDK